MPAPKKATDEAVLQIFRENPFADLTSAAEALGYTRTGLRLRLQALEATGKLRVVPAQVKVLDVSPVNEAGQE